MALVFSDRAWPLLTARSRVRGHGGSGVPGRSSGAAGHKGISPCRGKTAVRVAMMARPAGSEGCSQTRTARTPRVSPRSSARVRSGRCAARRTPATGRGSAFRGRPAGPRRRRAGASRSAAPPGPGHTRAAGQQPAPAGPPTRDAHTIAPAGSPSPRSSPSRSQTSANRHELRRRPPCSAGPLPLSGLLGLPPREASAAVAVTARDQRRRGTRA